MRRFFIVFKPVFSIILTLFFEKLSMHIAILTGGTSVEREVALRSGRNMKDW
jgi:hypothetical protein